MSDLRKTTTKPAAEWPDRNKKMTTAPGWKMRQTAQNIDWRGGWVRKRKSPNCNTFCIVMMTPFLSFVFAQKQDFDCHKPKGISDKKTNVTFWRKLKTVKPLPVSCAVKIANSLETHTNPVLFEFRVKSHDFIQWSLFHTLETTAWRIVWDSPTLIWLPLV